MPILRHIYDSATGTYHDVEVTQEVYDFYRRNTWAIRRNDKRFYAHEIQFTSLLGSNHDPFEHFDEFLSDAYDPLNILCSKIDTLQLIDAFQRLPIADQVLLCALVVEGRTERECGQRMMVAQQTIHNRKKHALQKLQQLIETG